jgi:uncharacterized protein YegL
MLAQQQATDARTHTMMERTLEQQQQHLQQQQENFQQLFSLLAESNREQSQLTQAFISYLTRGRSGE